MRFRGGRADLLELNFMKQKKFKEDLHGHQSGVYSAPVLGITFYGMKNA